MPAEVQDAVRRILETMRRTARRGDEWFSPLLEIAYFDDAIRARADGTSILTAPDVLERYDVGAELVDPAEADRLIGGKRAFEIDDDLRRSFDGGDPAKWLAFSWDVPILPASREPVDDGTIIFRFLGAAAAASRGAPTMTASDPAGEWWGVGPLPSTEAEWRSLYAIKPQWNGDGVFVGTTVGELRRSGAWTAVERVGITGGVGAQYGLRYDGGGGGSLIGGKASILRGGGRQLWVPPGTINLNTPGGLWPDVYEASAWNPRR